jgi:hypothetical protein
MARLADSGKAAKIKPSMTKTNPSAARKSDMRARRGCYRAGAEGAGVPDFSRGFPEGSVK